MRELELGATSIVEGSTDCKDDEQQYGIESVPTRVDQCNGMEVVLARSTNAREVALRAAHLIG